jgi:hypothetical protein
MTECVLWKSRVYQALKDVSDLAFQQRAWLTGRPEVSSFVETYCSLYDDCCFLAFLALNDTVWQQLGLTEHIREEMKVLHQMLAAYKEPATSTDAAILADPAWHAVVKQAQRVLAQPAEASVRN